MHEKPDRRRRRAARRPAPPRGVALILAMMLLALSVLVGAAIMERLERDRTRTENTLLQEQAWAYLLAAEALAIRALAQDRDDDAREGNSADNCDESGWAIELGPLPYDNGVFQLSIQDLQGRLNINDLLLPQGGERVVSQLGVERLKRLLAATLPDGAQADTLAEELSDWLDGNTLVDGLGGAEDTEYEGWRTANLPAAHVSELRALRSATVALWRPADGNPLFSRYITALPMGMKVNVNTAPKAVLASLSPGMDSARVEAIVAAREQVPFTQVLDVLALPELATLPAAEQRELKGLLAVGSEYFQVVAQVTVGDRTARLVSQLYRPAGGGITRVIQRDAGAVFAVPEPACNPE